MILFPLFATGVNNTRGTGGKICRRCRWYRWQICRRCRWYWRQFATGVVDTGGAPWLANISANFLKNLKWSYCYYQGLGGRWFMKQTWSKKSRDTVPLRRPVRVRHKSIFTVPTIEEKNFPKGLNINFLNHWATFREARKKSLNKYDWKTHTILKHHQRTKSTVKYWFDFTDLQNVIHLETAHLKSQ